MDYPTYLLYRKAKDAIQELNSKLPRRFSVYTGTPPNVVEHLLPSNFSPELDVLTHDENGITFSQRVLDLYPDARAYGVPTGGPTEPILQDLLDLSPEVYQQRLDTFKHALTSTTLTEAQFHYLKTGESL